MLKSLRRAYIPTYRVGLLKSAAWVKSLLVPKVMGLLQSAKLHGHDPWGYLKDVLTRLPGPINSRIDDLLQHRRQPG